jgi:hypothetical protein
MTGAAAADAHVRSSSGLGQEQQRQVTVASLRRKYYQRGFKVGVKGREGGREVGFNGGLNGSGGGGVGYR